MEYYGRQMEWTAIEINENAAISHFIRAAQKGKLPPNISQLVLERLEELNKTNPITMKINETENLDEYMRKVAENRLQFGRMPRECSDFIMKQAILQKQDINKYSGMVERTFEDFSEYELENSNIYGYYIQIVAQPLLNKKILWVYIFHQIKQ